jgi:hypothetical protein
MLHQAIKFFEVSANESLSDITKQITCVNIITGVSVAELAKVQKKQISEIYLKLFALMETEPVDKLSDVIQIDGQKYGFIPDINAITLGEFSDIDTLSSEGFSAFNKMLAVLYRPLVLQTGDLYTITDYHSEDEKTKQQREVTFLKKMNYYTAQSAIWFFFHSAKQLLKF